MFLFDRSSAPSDLDGSTSIIKVPDDIACKLHETHRALPNNRGAFLEIKSETRGLKVEPHGMNRCKIFSISRI